MSYTLAPQHRVFAAFAVLGLTFGGIFTRIGDIQISMGVGQSAVGAALIGAPLGMMTAVTLLTPQFERVGFRFTFMAAIPLLALFAAVASLAPTPPILFGLLFLFGLAAASANTVVNVEADRTEFLIGRRIMNRAHATFSLGFLTAATIGAAARQLAIAPINHLLAMAVVSLFGVVAVWWNFMPAPARPQSSGSKAPLFAVPTMAVLVAGVFTLAGMVYEGAAADWGAIYMRDVFSAAPFIGGLALTCSSTAQTLTRFFSDRFVDRHGAVMVARVMLVALGLGALIATLSPFAGLALVGFALMGAGNAVIMPLTISAVARRSDRPSAINVAALTQLSWIAFFGGPPLIGFIAEHVHVRLTFGAALPLVALSFLLATLVLRDKADQKP
jgi:Major Facilitator Superfamily